MAAVGDARDDELRHASQQLLVVERLGQLLRRLEQEREPRARALGLVLYLRSLDDGCEVVRDRPREKHLAVAPVVRRVAIEHEPAELPATADQRDEREGCDPLLPHDALERGLVARTGDILDEDRLRVRHVGRPRRAALGVRAVAVGEAAPGAEAEHSLVVCEQHRGSVGAGRLEQRVESRLEHLVERRRAGDRVGEAVDGVEVAQPRAQLLALAHIARGAEHEAKLAVLLANRRSVDLEPRVASALAAEPDRDGVDVRSVGDLVPRLRGETPVIVMDQLEHRHACEVGRLPAEMAPRTARRRRSRRVRSQSVTRSCERSTTSRRTVSSRLSTVAASGSVPLLVAQPPSPLLLVAVCPICGGKARPEGKRRYGPCRDRTCDLGIKSPLLYQLS